MIKKIFFLIIVSNFSFTLCFAQIPSPAVKCVSVAANGDVTITWPTPTGSGTGFLDYKIFYSLSPAGPYTLVPPPIIPYAANFGTHIGAGANANRIYYLVQTENTGPVLSDPVDTFSTIFLTLTNLVNTAQLNWTAISAHPITSSNGIYSVYREQPAGSGNWVYRGSTQSLSYTDVINICDDTLCYRIQIGDDSVACTSFSNVVGGRFKDQTPPTISPIDTVSVDTANGNKATISWIPSPSLDCDSVVIYQWSGASWNQIVVVPVPQTFYLNPLSNAGNVSEMYSIAFKDSCNNISPIGIPEQTIYLSASFSACTETADLIWNKYINWNPATTQFEILVSVNGGTYTPIATVPASDTTYQDTGLVIQNSYCYIVRAHNGFKTSSSNKTCFIANVPSPPTFTYNRFATVQSGKSILITGYVDPAPAVKYYNLLRATDASGNFSFIAPIVVPSGNNISYTDNTVNTQTHSYSYKFDAMDSCGKPIMISNRGTTMLLNASVVPYLGINLTWNNYGTWPDSVDHYEIYRAVDGVWNPSSVASVPYSHSGGDYTDDVSTECTTGKGIFSYYVIAIEGNGNTFGFKDSSKSNTVEVYEYPEIYVPNAFTPNGDGLNDTFLPVACFVDPSNYSMEIFDTYGAPIATINSPTEGWDGKKKGHACMEGVYMYLIKCKAANGNDSQLSGTISLIR